MTAATTEPAPEAPGPADGLAGAARPLGTRVLLGLVALSLLGMGIFIARDLRRVGRETRSMFAGAVRGLDVTGDLQYQMQEARRAVLYALTTNDPDLQVSYADQSRLAEERVNELLRAHQSPPGGAAEVEVSFARHWREYLVVRDEVVASILEGSAGDAVARDLRDGVPAFQRVHDDLREMKRLHTEAAQSQLAAVEAMSRGSVARLVLILVLAQALVFVAARMLQEGLTLQALRRSESALRTSEAKFRTLADTVASAIFIYQEEGVRYVNSGAVALTGYERVELLAMRFWDLVHPDDREVVKTRGLARQQGSAVPSRYEFRIVARNGEVRWLDFTAGLTEFDGRPAVLGTAFDVTDRKSVEELIQYQAHHDALTGLPNRVLFLDRLSVALARARRLGTCLGVMFLDLDHFKLVNDTLGHGAGDLMLVETGRRLREALREDDTVARVGGDEFTVLLPEIARAEDASGIAQKLLDALSKPFLLQGHDLFLGASIGIGLHPSDGDDAETLMKNADSAMYRAKDLGRNHYELFTPSLNQKAGDRLQLESGLRRALERDEFRLHYQAQVAASDGRLVGVEALVRWQHPERGLLFPAEFVPLAEDTAVIVSLDEWVLREACRQSRRWRDAGLPLVRLAVNLSLRQFQRRDLVRSVSLACREAAFPPSSLELEITETTAMLNVDLTVSVLRGLRELGVRITIDDFGTGHSSLSHLKRLPVDGVKIDRSFVRDMTIDAYDAAIVTSVIEMAHGLKLKVVAEGVETVEQLQFLKDRACDEVQGYLVGRPLPPDELAQVVRALSGQTTAG